MKKAIVLFLCVFFALSLCACHEEETTDGNSIVTGRIDGTVDVLSEQGGAWVPLGEATSLDDKDMLWMPGESMVKVLKITNVCPFAFQWALEGNVDGELSGLSDVIDVYVQSGVTDYPSDMSEVASWECLGTLREVSEYGNGMLTGDGELYYAVALRMRESASNSYANMKLGAKIELQMLFSQISSEEDSFGNQYAE